LRKGAQDTSVLNIQTAHQILSYLHSTKHDELLLQKPTRDQRLEVKIYIDAAYSGVESKSQTGVMETFGQQPINWYTRKRDSDTIIVASRIHSTCEAARQLLQDDRNTNAAYRQQICIKSSKDTSLSWTEPAYRPSIPLPPTIVSKGHVKVHSHREAAAGRYSHENHPNEFHNIMDKEMDEIEEWF
jgi:hypothetical protein